MKRVSDHLPAVLVGLALFLMPVLLWGHLYIVGGDDTRLYYIFPDLMLKNYAFNIISNNTLGASGGYQSAAFFVPLLLIFSAVKRIFHPLNIQMLLYGANLAVGFYFLYRLLDLFHPQKTVVATWSKIAAALTYVFSLYLIRTLYEHQLMAIYIVGYFPAVLYFFLQGIRKDDIWRTLVAVVVYSALSGTILTFPWFGATCVALLPLVVIVFLKHPVSALKHAVVFMMLTVLLNVSWLAHQFYPVFVHSQTSNILSKVTSNELKQNNIDLIQALSHLNGPINQFAAYLRSSWADRNNMQAWQSFGIVYILVILSAGIFFRKISRKLQGLYILSVTMLLWTMLLVTPNFGDWNLSLFIFFNNHIPFFTMFRNMFDKFAYPMTLVYAFALAVSLAILEKRVKNKLIVVLLPFVVLGITLFNARSFILPQYAQSDFSIRISGKFNPDYLALTRYIQDMHEPSRFLWLPLNFASYVAVTDANNPGHFYYGSSPLQFLAGASDYTGFQSFFTAADPDLNFQLMGLIQDEKFADVARILQRMNAKYIIVDHQQIPGYGGAHNNFEGIIDAQTAGFYEELLGKKIRDFGTEYSLYSINPVYMNDKIFLTESIGDFIASVQPVRFRKISESEYSVSVHRLRKKEYLAFLEPFNGLWKLQIRNPESGVYIDLPPTDHVKMFTYANGFVLDPVALKQLVPEAGNTVSDGNTNVSFRLVFVPAGITKPALIVSALSWIVLSAALVSRLAYLALHSLRGKR